MGFYGSIVDPKELVGRSHHVDPVRLSLGSLFVHELVDRFLLRRLLKIDGHDQKQCSS